MKNCYRVMLGKGSIYAKECFAGGFMGTYFGVDGDLSSRLHEDWRVFNRELVPEYLSANPDKSRIAAGLACGAIWTVSRGIREGDYVLSPDGQGNYRVGEVSGDYYYLPDEILPHRRPVRWSSIFIPRADMSEALRNSAGSIGTVSDISRYAEEIAALMGGPVMPALIATDAAVEDPASFAMEKHLEAFLVQNWSQTELGKHYDIFEEDGELIGQQYMTDTGPLDVLAISKDKKTLLVVELKKGRASDAVVGQVLRYMGYVQQELAEPGQGVRGVVIALEDDPRIRRALAMVPAIEFYRYQINFKLVKG